MTRLWAWLAALLLAAPSLASTPPDSLARARLRLVVGADAFAYVGGFALAYQLWYKEQPRAGFHWFDDSREWLAMDKLGHATTCYHVARAARAAHRWTGLSDRASDRAAAGLSLLAVSTIELFDGFYQGWGASWHDLVANSSGIALFYGQQALWQEQRLSLKYSFRPSPYAQHRPNLLGANWQEQTLKDYNGQTYWLSANLASFWREKPPWLPAWLNLAAGYGADGMTGGSENPTELDGRPMPQFDRTRQAYLSLDIDWSRVPARSPWLRGLLRGLSFLKMPLPAVEFSPAGARWLWLGF